MDDLVPPLRIPTSISIAIAIVFATGGLLLWRSAAQSPSGHGEAGWLVQLVFAGGALAIAAIALYLARNRLVGWIGIATLVILFAL